jgi:hypothetical protein
MIFSIGAREPLWQPAEAKRAAFKPHPMKKSQVLVSLCLLFVTATAARAAHPFLCTDSYAGTVSAVSTEGKVLWRHACIHPQDCWVLPNGDYLFCHAGGALEMTPNGGIAWEYKAGEATEVHSCEPLPDGRVLVVENGPCRILEVDREGKIAKEIKLVRPPASVSLHDQFRGTRKTGAGHYLLCRKGEHQIEELDGEGNSLRRIPVPGDVHMCVLLPDGHFLIACGEGHKVEELDASLKVVWELNEHDLPGNPLRLVSGLQRLPNGDTVCCNYLGHGHIGEQPDVFEVTPDKRIVWEFSDHEHFKVINQIQLLDVPGDATKGEILR